VRSAAELGCCPPGRIDRLATPDYGFAHAGAACAVSQTIRFML
jgi:hypothetical protein